MSAANQDAPRMLVVRILWGSLFFSTCLFILVLLIQQSTGALPTEPEHPILLPVLGAVALMDAVIAVVLPRRMHRASLERAKLEVVTEVDERSGPVLFRDAAPTIRVFADSTRARNVAFPHFQTPFILGMALAESISLFGFILVMMGFPLLHALPFWFVCWALMIARFPTLKRVLGPLEEVHDAILK